MKISVAVRSSNGFLSLLQGPLFPSLPCPQITITRFQITNIRRSTDDPCLFVCDILVEGNVTSRLCDLIPGEQGIINAVYFTHNDNDSPLASFAVEKDKRNAGDAKHPFPFDGRFNFTVAAVPISYGNNTYRISARDKIYGLDGFSLWRAAFGSSPDEDFDAEDPETIATPALVEPPEFISGGNDGELAIYCFCVADAGSVEGLTLSFPSNPSVKFNLATTPAINQAVPVWPNTSSPAFFTVCPTAKAPVKAPVDSKVLQSIVNNPQVSTLSQKSQFLYGLGQGMCFEGLDLVFDSTRIVAGGIQLSSNYQGVRIPVQIEKDGRLLHREEILLQTGSESYALPVADSISSPALLWHMVDLFRMGDAKADEVCMALLLNDLSEMGLHERSMADWREYLYMCMAEFLENLLISMKKDTTLEQGYQLGRSMADATRMFAVPNKPLSIRDIGKAGFLTHLKTMRYFKPHGSGKSALRMLDDFISRLSNFLGSRS